MLSYDDSARAEELAERELADGMSVSEGTLTDLREAAREYGIYAPQIDEEYGGMGEDFRDVLPAFEEAGRSLLGQAAMRVDASDEGNMHLLELQGTDLQKEEYLKPLVQGELRSGFSMTEPQPGAGSDPKSIRTTAEKDGDEWVTDGHKWWTTQGINADILLVFARTDEGAHPYEGCSVFIVPAGATGVEVVRNIPHLGSEMTGVGHAEIEYNNVRVPEEHLLGEEAKGSQHVQERLGPARLTHCMRYSGMAERALDIAAAYMSERDALGTALSEKQYPALNWPTSGPGWRPPGRWSGRSPPRSPPATRPGSTSRWPRSSPPTLHRRPSTPPCSAVAVPASPVTSRSPTSTGPSARSGSSTARTKSTAARSPATSSRTSPPRNSRR